MNWIQARVCIVTSTNIINVAIQFGVRFIQMLSVQLKRKIDKVEENGDVLLIHEQILFKEQSVRIIVESNDNNMSQCLKLS